MKIIQIIPRFTLAGAERMAEALCLQLAEDGHTVIAVSMFDDRTPITDNLEKHGISVRFLNKKPGLDLRMISRMVRLFRAERPDVIHTHLYVGKYAIPAAILAGVRRRVHTVHNIADKESQSKRLQRFFYHHCNLTPVSISQTVQDSVCRLYQLQPQQSPVIFNGIRLSSCLVKTSYEKNGIFRFLHIGRFSAQKNHFRILNAFELLHNKYPDTSLTFIGTGEDFDAVCDAIAASPVRDAVFTPGVMSNAVEQYAGYDAFLLPSLYEGVPITLIEAMASAMPIAASAVGGIPDMITHDVHGLLCGNDPASIAEAMERLYLDEALRRRLGQAALAHCETFSGKTMTHAYLNVYKSL